MFSPTGTTTRIVLLASSSIVQVLVQYCTRASKLPFPSLLVVPSVSWAVEITVISYSVAS
jgi:hypothetical protein